MITIFEAIQQDHDQCRELIRQMIDQRHNSVFDIEQLTDKILSKIQSHERAEEQALFGVIKERSSDEDLIRDIYLLEEEHEEIETTLNDLYNHTEYDSGYRQHLLQLHEILERHWSNEEEVFPRTKGLISKEDSYELASLFNEIQIQIGNEIRVDLSDQSLPNRRLMEQSSMSFQ